MSERPVPSITPREAAAQADAGEPDERTLVVVGLAEVFREQIVAWRAMGRPAVPLLTLDASLPVRRGRCLSCGVPTEGWRCLECLEGIALALAGGGDQQEMGPQIELHHGRHVGAPERLGDVEAAIEDRSEPWRSPR